MSANMGKEILDEIKRLAAIADIGLLYSTAGYDRERYLELKEMSVRLLSRISDHPIEVVKEFFPLVKEYPTAKVDIRGLLLSPDKKILLVKESSDRRWSLPGGWADIGHSPREVVVKEVKEETGLDIIPRALLAVFDKRLHPHPPQTEYVYKMVIHCEATSSTLIKGFDILDAQYFEVDNLPPLSENRILKSQIEFVYKKITENNLTAHFD
jgi:ADP-ribose pyrophosphatase YjhB (NUDIX family)